MTGQVLHGSGRTTEVIRRAAQHSQREPENAGSASWHQHQDGFQVEKAVFGSRPADETEISAFHGDVIEFHPHVSKSIPEFHMRNVS